MGKETNMSNIACTSIQVVHSIWLDIIHTLKGQWDDFIVLNLFSVSNLLHS